MWETVLFISLLIGQLGRIQVTSNIAFYVHDIVIFLYLLFHVRSIIHLQWKYMTVVKPLWIIGIVCLLSLLGNVWRFQLTEIGVGLLYLLRYGMYTSVFLLVLASKRPQSYWFGWLYFLGIGYAVLGFFQLFLYPDLRNLAYLGWDPHYYRLFSSLFDPNFVGLILVVSFFLGLHLIEQRTKHKWVIMMGECVLFIALLLTYSRSSFLAAAIGACAYIVVQKKWKLLLMPAVFGMLVVLLPAFGGISTSVFRMWSVTARISNWQEGIHLFVESPIIGYGFNILRSLSRLGASSPYGYIANASGGVDNSILFILLTTGCTGLIAFIYLGMHLFRIGIPISKQSLKSAYYSILIALFVHSMFVNSMFYPQMLIWFWVFVGAVEEKKLISRS